MRCPVVFPRANIASAFKIVSGEEKGAFFRHFCGAMVDALLQGLKRIGLQNGESDVKLEDAKAYCRAEGAQACNNGISEDSCPYQTVISTCDGEFDPAVEWRAGYERALHSGVPRALRMMRSFRKASVGIAHAFCAWLSVPLFYAEDVALGLVAVA